MRQGTIVEAMYEEILQGIKEEMEIIRADMSSLGQFDAGKKYTARKVVEMISCG
jgi:hypothetical protein